MSVMAQPAKRRTTTSNEAAQRGQQKAVQASDRFSISFPTSDAMPEDVVWRRDMYRELDLTKDKNAPLYYPVTPIDNQCNLFTYLFRLIITGRVKAYQYNVVTGVESFEAKDEIDIEELLKDRNIDYKTDRQNKKITVEDADIPSAFVKRYYIRESSYLDQRTGTTHTKVTAICPIMVEGGGFGDEEDSDDYSNLIALFWLKYDDIAPYLAKLPVMASDLNNVTNMTADDYFTLNHYDGKIYKTNNMQGKTIKEYCKTDSAVVKEQKRIDKQLVDFEEHLWGHVEKTDSVDNQQAVNSKEEKKAQKAAVAAERKASRTRRTNSKSESTEEAGSAPRSTARRQRR